MRTTFLHIWLRQKSIATKLRLANFLTSGIVIFAAGGLLLIIYVFIAGESLLEQTRTDAAMTAENIAAAIVFNDPKTASEILSTLKRESIDNVIWPSPRQGKPQQRRLI